ncbi:MAG: sigma 54-interacting transcriptional regulator [Burkholderiales bacterium]|nr:sigma 54-interacting transcriptional regulator [Burkholderiales bacterium]
MADLYRAVFDTCGDALLVVDPVADRIDAANPALCALLGYAAEDLIDRSATVLFRTQRAELVVFTEAVLEQGRRWTRTLQPIGADGDARRVETVGWKLSGGGPRILFVLYDLVQRQLRDVEADSEIYLHGGIVGWRHAERLFRAMEENNRLLLDAAGEGIYGVNARGITTFVNPAGQRLLGWSAEELVGRNMHAVVHHSHADGSPYPSQNCPIYAAFRQGTVHQVDDEVFWRKDGTAIHVEYTSTPILERGLPVGAVIVFRDITGRQETERRLRTALEEVERLRERLELENAYLQEEIAGGTHPEIVGNSAVMQKVLRQVDLVAPTDATVLITGESGTGKELIARAIHRASGRRHRPLVRVNCAAIPRDLFESEFFGHVKGAFTGALRDRAGRFELADGGTLFLDEVGEIPPDLQGKLLRVLQEGQFERVGETVTRDVSVRVIAATHRDLRAEVRQRRFREDLYFRLNVFPIESPTLRERPDDIAPLADHLLRGIERKLKRKHGDVTLTRSDMQRLRHYDWPGNVRELENVIERAAILAQKGRLQLDLPVVSATAAIVRPPDEPQRSASAVLTEDDRRARDRSNIRAALDRCAGKVSGPGGAAELLGVKPTTLASRMRKLGIRVERSARPSGG